MKKRKPDKAERVARKLVTRDGTDVLIVGWAFRAADADSAKMARWIIDDLASALRKAGVRGR